MPFTASHIAAVLPLKKVKNLSLTGLISGSLVPDFEFFLQLREVSHTSGHSIKGMFIFDLPVALIFCFIFHNIIRATFIHNLPQAIQSRFMNYIDFNWNKYFTNNKFTVILSILIGIASHIILDEFTHHDGVFTQIIPFLAMNIDMINIPVYQILQISLSVIGLIYLLRDYRRLEKQPTANTKSPDFVIYWVIFAAVGVIILGARITLWSEHNTFWSIIMAIIGTTCYAWLSTSILTKIIIKTKITS